MLGFAPIATTPLGAPSANEAFTLTAQNGVYALSLQGAGKLITDIYPSGTFLLNGRAAGLSAGRPTQANSGTFVLEGQDVTLDQNYGVIASNGSFTLAVYDVELDRNAGLIAESGAFTLTGQDLTLQIDVSISAESGAFVLQGQNAARKISEVFDSGSFTLTANNADGLVYSRNIIVESSPYSITGQTVKFRGFLSLSVLPSIYTEQTDAASNAFTAATNAGTPIWTEVA